MENNIDNKNTRTTRGTDASSSDTVGRVSQVEGKPPRIRKTTSLTPSQLARKRANDREAQRTARLRTKEHIEDLEKRVEELSSTNKNAADLLKERQRNRDLEAEVAKLKKDLAGASNNKASQNQWAEDVEYLYGGAPGAQKDYVSAPIVPILDDDPLLKAAAFNNQTLVRTPSPKFPFYNNNGITIIKQPRTHWEVPVRFLPPDNPVDALLVSILDTQRVATANSPLRLSRPAISTPDLQTFIWPNAPESTDSISSSVVRVLASTAMKRIPETVASLYMIYKALQWQIRPALDTYDDMPAWFTPRPSQLMTPHPIWVSQIKFPKLRDKVIENQQLYANAMFLATYTASLCINWPWGVPEIFRYEGGKVTVSELFETHIWKIENWSLTEPFTYTYPELEKYCRFSSLVA